MLHIDVVQLAKLALCRRPTHGLRYTRDVAQIAAYVGVDRETLARFVHQAERVEVSSLGRASSVHGSGIVRKPGIWEGIMLNRRILAVGIALLAVIFVAAVAFLAQPATRADATLVVSAGQATITQARPILVLFSTRTQTVIPAGGAITIRESDAIVLGPGSTAQLRMADGSTVELYEGATVDLATLRTSGAGSSQVQLRLLAGSVYSRVRRLLGADETFQISTPSSTASVRGTAFLVGVLSDDATYVAVDEGIVAVQLGEQMVDVRQGEEVTAAVGQPLNVQPQSGDITPPPLALLSPAALPPVGSTVKISGQTEPGTIVTVDGQTVTVDASGYFEIEFAVESNVIIIKATDSVGNVTTLQLSRE